MYKYYLVGSIDNIFLFLKKCIELYIIRKEGRKEWMWSEKNGYDK